MVQADELNFDFLTELVAGVIDDNHGAIAQIGDALMRITASSNNFDFSAFAGEILIAEGQSEGIKVESVDMLGSSDLRKIVIIGQDETVISLREFHKTIIYRGAVKLVAQNRRVEKDNALKLTNGIETGTSAKTLFGIFAIGKELKLVCDAARNHDIVTDKTGFGNLNQTRVHKRGGVDIDFTLLVSGDERAFATFERQDRGFP